MFIVAWLNIYYSLHCTFLHPLGFYARYMRDDLHNGTDMNPVGLEAVIMAADLIALGNHCRLQFLFGLPVTRLLALYHALI